VDGNGRRPPRIWRVRTASQADTPRSHRPGRPADRPAGPCRGL